MKKILFGTKHQSDTTSWLRVWGAFTAPEMRPYVIPCRVPIEPNWEHDWTYYLEHDIILLHRPSSPQDRIIIQTAKQMGIPLWVDMDDDLDNVPESNPVWKHYQTPGTKEVIKMAIEEADVLSVGGEIHQERLKLQYKREVHLIPNAVHDSMLGFKKPYTQNKRIAWRGSKSHLVDLVAFKDEIMELITGYPDWQFFFFGCNPLITQDIKYPNVRWGDAVNVIDFYVALTQWNAEIQIVPLLDCEFNRVKSNLSWSDATLAGSVGIVPDFEEFRHPGANRYETKHGFIERIKEIMDRKIDGEKFNKNSWEWIKDNILMSRINKIRIEIIKNL